MRKDDVLPVMQALNGLLNSSDQTNTPERAQAAALYADIIREVNRDIERRRQLLESGDRAEALRYEPGESPLPELLPLLNLFDDLRYRHLCDLYGWPKPPRPKTERAKILLETDSGNCLSLRGLLDRWHREAGTLPVTEKIKLLRAIRHLDSAHARHWEQILPDLEYQYCADLFAQAEAARDEAELMPIVKELLTADWISAAPQAGREHVVAKLHDLQADSREKQRQELFHNLANSTSSRQLKMLEEDLTAINVLLSDPECHLSEAESRQKMEAEQLASELRQREQNTRLAAALSEKIGNALDEGMSYEKIAADYRTLQECGEVIDPDLARRVQAAAAIARDGGLRKQRSRQRYRLLLIILLLSAAGAAVYWYQLEKMLGENLTAAAAFLEEGRPHQAEHQLEPFLHQHPGLAARGKVVLLRQQTASALLQAEQQAAEFDRLLAPWEKNVNNLPTAADTARFRQQETKLKTLLSNDDTSRRQRLMNVTDRITAAEYQALRRREKENVAWCDRLLKEMLQEKFTARQADVSARQLSRLEQLSPPLTPLEKSALHNCRKQLAAWRQNQQEKQARQQLLKRLAAPVSAKAYLNDLATLKQLPPAADSLIWRQYALPWLDDWTKCSHYRLREPVFTGDREADELIRQIRDIFPDKMVRQILPRLFPAGKLAGEPFLKRLTEELAKWDQELAAPANKNLYELTLFGPQKTRYRFFTREAPELERAGRGRNRLLAMRLKVLFAPDNQTPELLTFRCRKGLNGHLIPERIGPAPKLPEFRQLPLSFAGIEGMPDTTHFTPRPATHLAFARNTIDLLKKAADRDEAVSILEKQLLTLSGQTQMEPLFRLQLADRHWQLLTTVESLYEPAAQEFRRQMTRAVPADWNPFSPAMALNQPQAAAAMTALLTTEKCRKVMAPVKSQREQERLALRRFPRPAGVMVPTDHGKRTKLLLFQDQVQEAELWQLTRDTQGNLWFLMVKAFGTDTPFTAAIPAGTLLFTPADNQPTPPPDKELPVSPLCWPLTENRL